MTDTRNKLQFFKEPVETKPSTDTDEIIEEYMKCLENIFEEDEEIRTIVNTNYVLEEENKRK